MGSWHFTLCRIEAIKVLRNVFSPEIWQPHCIITLHNAGPYTFVMLGCIPHHPCICNTWVATYSLQLDNLISWKAYTSIIIITILQAVWRNIHMPCMHAYVICGYRTARRSHKFSGDLRKITHVLRASRIIKMISTMLESSVIRPEITKGGQDFGWF